MIKGVIEGFYGKSWSWSDRLSYPQFLQAIGYNAYVYAPKADLCLRNHWFKDWSPENFQQLLAFSTHCAAHNIQFGIGLSPLGAFEQGKQSFDVALRRMDQILRLNPTILSIQFDDMVGNNPAFSDYQIRFCQRIEAMVPDSITLIICPSYYTTDPVLEQHFGVMPANYWPQLGQGLSSRWQFFWTGQKVVTLDYSLSNLRQIATLFKRKPMLWDNYPVNDGRLLWPYINTLNKPRSALCDDVAGVLHNPMNQAWCSKVAIAEMAGAGDEISELLLLPDDVWQWFDCHRELFQVKGLHNMTTQTKQQLLQFAALNTHPLISEVEKWLQGFYEFDPACLT